jgi:hypothetical protein
MLPVTREWPDACQPAVSRFSVQVTRNEPDCLIIWRCRCDLGNPHAPTYAVASVGLIRASEEPKHAVFKDEWIEKGTYPNRLLPPDAMTWESAAEALAAYLKGENAAAIFGDVRRNRRVQCPNHGTEARSLLREVLQHMNVIHCKFLVFFLRPRRKHVS